MWCPFNDLLLRKKGSRGIGWSWGWTLETECSSKQHLGSPSLAPSAVVPSLSCVHLAASATLLPSFAGGVKSSCSCRWRREGSSASVSLLHRIPFNLRQILFLTTPFEESRQMPLLLPEAIPWEERRACRAARASEALPQRQRAR